MEIKMSINNKLSVGKMTAPDMTKEKLMKLDSLVTYILSKKPEYKELNKSLTIMYIGDFYGLLFSLNVPIELHYLMLVLNNVKNPTEYDGNSKIRVVPSDVAQKIPIIMLR